MIAAKGNSLVADEIHFRVDPVLPLISDNKKHISTRRRRRRAWVGIFLSLFHFTLPVSHLLLLFALSFSNNNLILFGVLRWFILDIYTLKIGYLSEPTNKTSALLLSGLWWKWKRIAKGLLSRSQLVCVFFYFLDFNAATMLQPQKLGKNTTDELFDLLKRCAAAASTVDESRYEPKTLQWNMELLCGLVVCGKMWTIIPSLKCSLPLMLVILDFSSLTTAMNGSSRFVSLAGPIFPPS